MIAPTRKEMVLVSGFLVMLAAPAIVQTVVEWRRDGSVQALTVFRQRPTAATLRAYERELEDASWVAARLRPWIQFGHFAWLKEGGDKALLGRDGWLFYKPGFRYLTERAPSSASPSLDRPLAAITRFRDQLAERGIRLLVVPAPNKESIYPEMLSGRVGNAEVLVAPATRQLLGDLRKAGIEVVDLFEAYRAAKQSRTNPPSAPLYLAQDSHWSPVGVDLAARAVARRIVGLGWMSMGGTAYETQPAPMSRLGDIVRMLQIPPIERRTAPEDIACRQVVRQDTRQPYQDDPGSEILVLGDSFLRIYERDEPGAAGFIAHLAQELQRPLTSLVNDGGASTLVRQELHRRPALLKHKRVVIWEFVERDIRFGTEGWQCVPLPPQVASLTSTEH